MFTRISSVTLALLLLGCGDRETSNGPAPLVRDPMAKADAPAPVVPPKTLCAVDGDAAFAAACDRELTDGVLTLRHPGGGFRRLEIVTDGRGVIAADGSEPADVTTVGSNMIEVRIGADRYRLPAEVKR